MTVITTSNESTATAYSNQRKIDRTSNGVIWTFAYVPFGLPGHIPRYVAAYSVDDGATWALSPASDVPITDVSGRPTYEPNASFFIDVDDYAHVVYKNGSNGYIYYKRGTPNAARTGWTWSAAYTVSTSYEADCPDVIAHREGSGWAAHCVFSTQNDYAGWQETYCRTFNISSAGGITSPNAVSLGSTSGVSPVSYASIDFNHTGDGKTVAGGTPHLYVAWSKGATGAGKGIRFRKATYSGGTWTWGIESEIDSTAYAYGGHISSAFDGTRVVIAYADSASPSNIKIRERNAGDTTTTTRTSPALSDGTVSGISVTYDSIGNTYLAALGSTSLDPKIIKYDRATSTWGTWTAFTASAQPSTLTLKRGSSASRAEFVYTDGTASPYSVTYDFISLNSSPDAPTLVAPANGATLDPSIPNTFQWQFNDPDPGDTQSAYNFGLAGPLFRQLTQNADDWAAGTGSGVDGSSGALRLAQATFGLPAGMVAHLDPGTLGLADGATVTSAPAVGGPTAWTVQGTGPIYRAAGVNGCPYLEHSSTGTGLRWAGNLSAGNSTVFVVARMRGGAMQRILSGVSNNWLLGWWQGQEDVHYAMGWVDQQGQSATTDLIAYSARRTSGLNSFRRWGTLLAENSNGTQGPNGLGTNSGYNGTSEFSNSDVYEVIAYNRALTDTEVQQVFDYFASRYLNVTSYATSGTWTSPALDLSTLETVTSSLVDWQASTPAGTSLAVETSTDGGITWNPATNGGPIPGVAPGGTAQARLTLTSDGTTTPEVASLLLEVGDTTWSDTGWILSDISSHTASINTLKPGNYNWRVATKDPAGAESPWSDIGSFDVLTFLSIMINGTWTSVVTEVKINGAWTQARPSKF